MKQPQTQFLCCFALFVVSVALGNTRVRQILERHVPTDSKQQVSSKTKEDFPYCNLDSPQGLKVLEGAAWLDPLTQNVESIPTVVPRPISEDLSKQLKEEVRKDQDDEERLHKISRLVLDTRSDDCRIKEWDSDDFQKCLANRRMILVGDSMSMQMTESLSYMLDLTNDWIKTDNANPIMGTCRHCIDSRTSSGLHIVGRAIFHEDGDEKTPLKFSRPAWEALEESLGGWKQGDILVVNFGAHYMANAIDLRQDLKTLFHDILSKLPKDQVTVFWREYAPAHFQSFSDGEYPPSHQVKVKGEAACVPHLTAPDTPSIVESFVAKIMMDCSEDCAHIRKIPIWNLLRNAWDQHKEGSHCFDDEWCDCRHYAIPGPMEYANVLLYNQLCVPSPQVSSD